MSLATHRLLRIEPATVATSADQVGPDEARRDGACLTFSVIEP
jgi:hypothetical protein